MNTGTRTSINRYKDRMPLHKQEVSTYTNAWRPVEGETIIGEIVGIQEASGQFGKSLKY